ncbi:hypothetical protein EGR_05543 [Echinococcus granulosus]|uniref:Uncharacterized protein n=1 Tax=Echinococcus granulosus TaxID=6210 RepID=W6V1B6_ECHGR|nr:hypothetical protein EGR_05543 [Echinococcus granulosus]EUB59644.1 hypothetical protein EGR_05543 [Echinococcus granulosus]
MKGKRHFLTKRTSLFGSENEENVADCASSSISSPKAASLNNNASGKAEPRPEGGQKDFLRNAQPNRFVHFETDTPAEKSLNDLGSGDIDIIEEAKYRAKERQMLKRDQKNHEETDSHSYLTDLESSLIQKYAEKKHDSRPMDPSSALELTRPTTDDSGKAQKELLELRMSERPPVTHTVQPPWYIEGKPTHKIVSPQSKSEPKKWNFQRTCNQIDFPSYTAEEMRGARPTIMMDSRHKKCTWMPSLAPEVVAESQVGRRSISSKLSPSESLEGNEASSSRRANDVNLPTYPKMSAPYAMD